MRTHRSLLAPAAFALLAACGPAADVDSADGRVANEGALDEDSIVEFLNGPDATVALLTDDVRIQRRAATNIVSHVRGADGALGTRDDDLLEDVAELDAIRYVGPATIEAIEAYVRSHYQSEDLTIENVALSAANAAAMVALANSATERVLDDDVGLDSRAASAIVAARPIASIQALAVVSYVGTSALVKLRDYVITHPGVPVGPGDAPPATIVSATATDKNTVVVTYSRAIDPTTPSSAFAVFISEPDAGVLSGAVSITGNLVTLATDDQDPGTDYTFEAEATVLDAEGNPVDPNNGR